LFFAIHDPLNKTIVGSVMHGSVAARTKWHAAGESNFDFSAGEALQRVIAQLMPRLRIAVIFGGNKAAGGSVVYQSQNTRSWKSYEAVAEDIAASLRRSGFHNVDVMPEDMQLSERLRRNGIHMAWLNSGGVQGHNSAAHGPSTLEMLGIPYVGHDPLSATTLDNKHIFKSEAVRAGLPTAAFSTWDMTRGPFQPNLSGRFNLSFGDYSGPFIVKPVSGRASLHVHVVPDLKTLPDVISEVYRQTKNLVLIEKYLPGREFCIAVAGRVMAQNGTITRHREPFAFGAIERVFTNLEMIFTSMDSRPITASRFKNVEPQEAGLWKSIHKLARDVFLEFNLGSLIRIDLRADEAGKLYILEANPKPDLKCPSEGVTSLVSAGLSQTPFGYDDLLLSLLADRLDFLLCHNRDAVHHITSLIETGTIDRLASEQRSRDLEDASDLMVQKLSEAAQLMRMRDSR
jgi:D-alanine-D-alanine ligase